MDKTMTRRDNGRLLFRHIEEFERKLLLCRDKISVPLLARMISRCLSLLGGQNKLMRCNSLRHIRSVISSVKKSTIRFKQTSEISNVFRYFDWFFDLHTYLLTLKHKFVTEIFRPLAKRHATHGMRYTSGTGSPSLTHGVRHTPGTGSPSSRLSEVSQTTDSGISASSSGQFHLGPESGFLGLSRDSKVMTDWLVMLTPCPDIGDLYEEFGELRQLYDFTEINEVIDRIQNLFINIEELLNGEEPKTELFSPDSYRSVANFTATQPGVNVLRLIPDVLIKLEKTAWLTRKWLRLISDKPHDGFERLSQIENVEKKLSARLARVKLEVSNMESRLEEQVMELNVRLLREDRAGDMNIALYEIDTKISLLRTELESARKEKLQIKNYLLLARKRSEPQALKQLLAHYHRNQIHRFSVANRIWLLSYQRALMEDDMNIELNLKPSVVTITNSAQEMCDKLESSLDAKRNEETTIERALLHVRLDKKHILSRLSVKGPDTRSVGPTVHPPSLISLSQITYPEYERWSLSSPDNSESS